MLDKTLGVLTLSSPPAYASADDLTVAVA